MYAVDVAAVQSDWMCALGGGVLETEEVVGHLGRASHLTGTVQSEHQQVHNEAIILNNERSKLEPPDDAVGVGVVHVLREQLNKKLKYQHTHGSSKRKIELKYINMSTL